MYRFGWKYRRNIIGYVLGMVKILYRKYGNFEK